MKTAISKFKGMLVVAGTGAALLFAASSAGAAECRSTVDSSGDAVVMCGSVAYYADEDDDRDGPEMLDDMFEDEGTLFVDPEDCEPGKYWMLETDDIDVPLACH